MFIQVVMQPFHSTLLSSSSTTLLLLLQTKLILHYPSHQSWDIQITQKSSNRINSPGLDHKGTGKITHDSPRNRGLIYSGLLDIKKSKYKFKFSLVILLVSYLFGFCWISWVDPIFNLYGRSEEMVYKYVSLQIRTSLPNQKPSQIQKEIFEKCVSVDKVIKLKGIASYDRSHLLLWCNMGLLVDMDLLTQITPSHLAIRIAICMIPFVNRMMSMHNFLWDRMQHIFHLIEIEC